MKNRNELIEYFIQSLEYDDKNNIIDELKEEYNDNYSVYMQAEKRITDLLSFEEFDDYDTATTYFMNVLSCNTFVLGYEQCKKDILNHINGTTKKR